MLVTIFMEEDLMYKKLNEIYSNKLGYYLLITIAAEVIIIAVSIINRDKLFMLVGSVVILFAMVIVINMMKSLESSIYTFIFAVPLLPLSGYISLLLKIIDYQWIFYIGFYSAFLISLYKNRAYIRFKNIEAKNYIYVILIILSFANIFFAYDKRLSFTIIIFGFVPFTMFFAFLYKLDLQKDKEIFLDNLIISLLLGVLASGIPDFCKFIYANMHNMYVIHLTGPLGSNFIIAYSLMVYPILLISYNTVKNHKLKNIYLIMIILQNIIFAIQRSRGLLITLIFLGTFLIVFNKKKYRYYLLIFGLILPIITHNVYLRNDITRFKTKYSTTENISVNEIVYDQMSTRIPIWEAAINIIKDYPITGVGNGNFGYYFKKYVKGNIRSYSDAHNFVLTLASEEGIIFTFVLMLYLIYICVDCCKSMIIYKRNYYMYLKYLGLLAGAFSYFIYANITGAALQHANEVHSYTPTFLLIFMIYYYNTIKYARAKQLPSDQE